MFLIILAGVCVYLFGIQTRLGATSSEERTMAKARIFPVPLGSPRTRS